MSSANRRSPATLQWCLILYWGLWPLCSCFGGARQLCLCLDLAFHIWIFHYFLALPLYKNKQTKKNCWLCYTGLFLNCVCCMHHSTQSWFLLLSRVWWLGNVHPTSVLHCPASGLYYLLLGLFLLHRNFRISCWYPQNDRLGFWLRLHWLNSQVWSMIFSS